MDYLQQLIADPRFLRYHAETRKGNKFNPFDVLRYSDYEIRHSNVLAWLFQPDETHGVGDAFLRDFTTAMNEAARSQGIPPIPLPSSFDLENVRVERELDYVDITLFFKSERVLIAIENKTGERSPEHADQVVHYEETLRKKYSGSYDVIQSVLLTTSPSADASERRFIHVNWDRIHGIVKSIRESARFEFDEGEEVRTFLGHYLEIVENLVVPPATDKDCFKTLLDDYRPVLEKLSKEQEERSGEADEGLPEALGEYRSTIGRLLSDFRQELKRLRSAIRALLKRRGFRAWTNTPRGQPWLFLYFSTESMEETRRSLNLPWCPRWVIFLSYQEVLLYLQFDPPKKKIGPVVDRITEFMKEHPIDVSPEGVERYPMDFIWGEGRFIVYQHSLVTDEDLSAIPASKIEDVTLRKMEAFLDQDFRRIETYLKCLAFDPAVPV